MQTKFGFWSKHDRKFINIRKILPGNQIRDIYVYEFDEDNRMLTNSYASHASYEDGRWILKRIKRIYIGNSEIKQEHLQETAWDCIFNPQCVESDPR